MTAEHVDAVIAAVERHDPVLAKWMRAVADGLTAGEGEELISQASLQRFLWYEVPKKLPHETWHPVVEAAGVLLSLLGLDRYAAIARSPTTASILEAWERAPAQGFARFRAARSSSGVEPPDTELLAWGDVMGMEEASASHSVEQALERAITAGDPRHIAVELCADLRAEFPGLRMALQPAGQSRAAITPRRLLVDLRERVSPQAWIASRVIRRAWIRQTTRVSRACCSAG